MQTRSLLRPLGLGDLLDAAIRLYRAQLWPLVAISVIGWVPLALSQTLAYQMLLRAFTPLQIQLVANAISFVLQLLLGSVLSGALVIATAAAHTGQPIAIGGAYRAALARYPALLVALFIPVLFQSLNSLFLSSWLGALTAMLFGGPWPGGVAMLLVVICVVPLYLLGLPLYARVIVTPQVLLLERQGPLAALRRSWRLSRGATLRCVIIIVATSLAVRLFTWVPTLLWYAFGRFVSYTALLSVPIGLLGFVIATLLQPAVVAIVTVLYYDLRVRGEGYDLELAIGLPAPGSSD